MTDSGYTNIIQVFETCSPKEANKYLDLGWVLIKTYTTCSDTVGPLVNDQRVYYVLGWISDKGEIKYPPKEEEKLPKYGEVY